jgi:hypothetical protein
MYKTFAIACVLLLSPAAQAEPFGQVTRVTALPQVSVVRVVSDLPLTAEQQQRMDAEFDAASYFSALAMTPEGGWGAMAGTNSLRAARAIALQSCERENPDNTCTLVAEVVPEGYADPVPGEVLLNPAVGTYYFAADTAWLGFSAVAISEDGAWGFRWGYADQAEADAAALDLCQESRGEKTQDFPDWPCFLVPGQ